VSQVFFLHGGDFESDIQGFVVARRMLDAGTDTIESFPAAVMVRVD